MANPMRKNALRFGIIFFLTAVFFYFFFQNVEWAAVWRSLADVNPLFFALVILLAPLHLATRGWRWRYLLLHEKKNPRFFNLFAANAVGFTVTMIFPGRLGEVVKPIYLARKEGMKSAFVIGTVIVERIFDIFTNCSLLGIFLLARPLYASVFKISEDVLDDLHFWGIFGISAASFLLFFILILYFFRERALSVIAFLLKPFSKKASGKILHFFQEFIMGLKFFHSLGNLLMYILFSYVVWLGVIFTYWLFFFAYKLSYPYYLVIPYVFLVAVGASIPTPGMAGGFHYFSKLGLTTLFGVDPNQAVGMTIVIHGVQLVMTCVIGYAILWKEGLTLFQLKKMGEAKRR